jgi:hypothetical protein
METPREDDMRTLLLLLTLLPFFCPRANAATVHCVNSAAALQGALTTAQSNGDDDYIYVLAAVFPLNAGLTYFSTEDRNLILVGGYDTGCNGRVGRTTLNGQNTVRPLYVSTDSGNLLVEGFDFLSGRAEGSGGALYFDSGTGNASIQLNRFIGNRSLASGGAIRAITVWGTLFVFNNLVYGNRADQVGGMLLDHDGDGLVTNNTVYGNITDTPTVPGGALLQGTGHFDVSNNIFWDNTGPGGADFRADTAHGRRHNNIAFVANSVAPDSVTGEQSVSPRFVTCGLLCITFDLRGDSPLIDAGSDAALQNFVPGLVDLRGKPRVMGLHVDIGAHELDPLLFKDGFDS